MALELVARYVLYVDDKATEVGQSLDEAKRLAENYIAKGHGLRIESGVGPAPKEIWNYDYDLRAWRE